MNAQFWRGKRIFITGHTGFKGSWLAEWLLHLGAEPMGLSLAPDTNPALFEILDLKNRMRSQYGDIRSSSTVHENILAFKPEIVLHLAAQPLVRDSYKDPIGTFATNVMGTAHVVDAVRNCPSVKAAVMVTTDKVYENPESNLPFREDQPLGGHDPYSASKACSEIVVSSMRRSFPSAPIASARAGNVIGGGDWARDRLIPDIIRCRSNRNKMLIRNPSAVRPWQHVLESLSGYLLLAERLVTEGEKFAHAFNFGPAIDDCRPVEEVLSRFAKLLPGGFDWEVEKSPQPHEARFLRLDCSKAFQQLDWQPRWNLDIALSKTAEWYGVSLEGGAGVEWTPTGINKYANPRIYVPEMPKIRNSPCPKTPLVKPSCANRSGSSLRSITRQSTARNSRPSSFPGIRILPTLAEFLTSTKCSI